MSDTPNSSNRTFSHFVTTLLLGVLATAPCQMLFANQAVAVRPAADKPNVVIFFLDDSGYGDYAHNGNPTISTPSITRLKQDGVNFSQFYVTSPACSASRYSLLTGRYPSRSGLGGWVIGPGARRHLHADEVTLAEGLKANGYATGIFGKWHLGTPNKANEFTAAALPLAHGFDEFTGTNVSHDYGSAMLLTSDPDGKEPIDGYKVIARELPRNVEASASLTKVCTEAAVQFISKNRDKPFFAYVPFNMPHLGIFVSERYKGVSRRGLLGDCMAEIDDAVAKVRATIAEAGLTQNTIVVFASDNGPWVKYRDLRFRKIREYGEARLHVGYAMPFRDGKGSTWEGGHRVPGIVCWPGVIEGNRVVQEPTSTIDLLPTIFALTGAKLPVDNRIDGRDIRSLLVPGTGPKLDPFTFYYHAGNNRPSALRMGPWKLHVKISSQTGNNYGFSASREKPLLFQVEQDLGERIDRSKEEPEIATKMLAELESYEKEFEESGSYWD